jgi:hypothetical protein
MGKNLDEYMTADQLFDWGKTNFNIIKPNSDLSEDEITRIVRWIGECSYDTIYTDGDKFKVGRHGINNILFVMLMTFPKLYIEWGLPQPN